MKGLGGGDRVTLALALLAAALLRIPALGLAELTTDEAFSWRLASYPVTEIVTRTAADVHPPLYYVALSAWRRISGDSPSALRGLSALLGLAAVPLAYVLAREVARGRQGAAGGGAVAAVLVALHADQVGHSREARMYALGGVLAGLSAWLMLRALRAERRSALWWAAYAMAAAGLCYTHYYGAFTVGAQVLYAGLLVARSGLRSRLPTGTATGLVAAVLGAAVLYGPWLPVLRRQTARVGGDYWIREMGPWDVAAALMRWSTGLEWAPAWPTLVIGVFAAAAVWALWRGDAGQRFLILQAVLPWLGALALSWSAGRPLVLERYLFFSQIALLVLAGGAWVRLGRAGARAAAALPFGVVLALGLVAEIGSRPRTASSAAEAARVLATSAAPGDLVCANAPRDLNVLLYYLRREGREDFHLACPASRAIGHLSQVSSLTAEEILPGGEEWAPRWARVWKVRLHPPRKWRPEPPPPGWNLFFTRVFEGPSSARVYLTAYQPAAVQ
jgi:mannosyltransferase